MNTTLAWNDNEVNWANVEIDCPNSLYGEPTDECGCKDDPATDGMIKLTMGQWDSPTDQNLLAWQTLDPAIDGNAIIKQDHEYRVYFDTFKWQNPSLTTYLYYGYIPDNNLIEPDVNVITSLDVSTGTTYQTFMMSFIAEGGQPYIGEPLGIRFWEEGGGWYWIDSIRVQFRPLTKSREPEPAGGAVDLPRSGITLRWEPGKYVAADVNSHEVYFGTDKTAVQDANTNTAGIYRGNASGGPDGNDKYYYTLPDTLPLGQRCYWRVDEVNEGYAGPNPPPNGRWTGDVWSFRVTGTALSPSPSTGATDVPVYTDLSWTAGTGAQKHDVYFGTDHTGVTDATTNSSEYLGRQTATTVANSSLVPAPLLSTKYYWRIDEVNETSGLIVDGDIWNFTTAEYTRVEDFDGYPNTDPALFAVWKDYVANDTGAQVVLRTVAEDAEDGNSLEYYYNSSSSPYYSEAYADMTNLGVDSNWTLGGVEALRLAFKGTYNNDIEPMYVLLTDGSARTGKVLYDGDPNALKRDWTGFHDWNIRLTDFVDDNSVDLTDVQRLTIGFGDKTAGGTGTVYFDNIRLHPPRCIPQLAPSMGYFRYIDRYAAEGSFIPDCTVDNYDLRTMAGDWLISGLGSVTATTAGTSNLVGHWPMDDDDPQMEVDDVSGNNNHGTLSDEDRDPGRSTSKHSVDPGAIGKALSFDGVDDYVQLPTLNLNSNTVTVSAWVRPDGWLGEMGSYPPIVSSNEPNGFSLNFGSTAAYADLQWMANNELTYFWTGWSWDFHSELIMPPELWSFVALVVEPTKGTLYLYDGVGMSASVNYEEHEAKAFDDVLFIGGPDFAGAIDDVRIYNRSVAPEEILDLAGLGGTHHLGLEPWRPDLDGDDTVNLKDYAVTADNWLTEVAWP